MTREQLEAQFVHRVVPSSGNLLILSSDDAIQFIRAAHEARIPVLGIDGFILSAGQTISPVEHLADFSSAVASGCGCWSDAEAFITSRQSLAFEITLGNPLPPGTSAPAV